MHKTIGLLMYGENEEEAENNAVSLIDDITGEGKYYDYGSVLDDRQAVLEVESEEGKKLIKQFMDYTKQDVFEALQKIRRAIDKYSDEEIFEEEVLDVKKKVINKLKEEQDKDFFMIRYQFNKVGDYDGACIWLYNFEGEGIRNSTNLKWALEHYNKELKEKKKGEKLFIVLCDVHF